MGTLVKKSLHPAAKASCLSLCSELAVRATIMTGLLNKAVFIRLSSSPGLSSFSSNSLPPGKVGVLEALFEKTPILFTRSSLLISFVASSPFMIGNWISINTRWKPPPRHFLTASCPFIAVCHLTFNRFMNASRSLRLMMLSSTIRTLMGGTAPSRSPAGNLGWFAFVLVLFCPNLGRGEEVRSGGGVETRCGWASEGIGGVGMGGGLGMPFGCCLRGSFGTVSQERMRCG